LWKRIIEKWEREQAFPEVFDEKEKQKYFVKLDKNIKKLKEKLENKIKNIFKKFSKDFQKNFLCDKEMINFLGNYEDMMTELEINYYKELRKQIIGKEEINLVINSPKCEKSRGGFLLSGYLFKLILKIK